MKTKIIITILSIFFINGSYSATSAPAKALEEKNVDDVKTFDFKKIFEETEKYFQAAQTWKKIKCTPKTGFICTKRECPKVKIVGASYMILDRKAETIALCKDKECRYFKGEFEQVGVFINAKVKNSDGLLVRVLGDSRFKEISMIGLDAYITNGECVPMVDEDKKDKK